MVKKLKELYIEKGWDINKFFKIRINLNEAIRCPCIKQSECIHKILPDHEIGGIDCLGGCEASKIWSNMKIEIKRIINKYLGI